jgi:hypothetical protein
MSQNDIADELKFRIQGDIEHFHGVLPERTAIAWRAYLAAVLEWEVLDVSQYDRLVVLLPAVTDDPAVAILKGRS